MAFSFIFHNDVPALPTFLPLQMALRSPFAAYMAQVAALQDVSVVRGDGNGAGDAVSGAENSVEDLGLKKCMQPVVGLTTWRHCQATASLAGITC